MASSDKIVLRMFGMAELFALGSMHGSVKRSGYTKMLKIYGVTDSIIDNKLGIGFQVLCEPAHWKHYAANSGAATPITYLTNNGIFGQITIPTASDEPVITVKPYTNIPIGTALNVYVCYI